MFTPDSFCLAVSITPALSQRWFDLLVSTMAEFGIDTPQRQAAFLSQIRVESAGFKRTVENLNYSVPGLLNTFPRKRISRVDAERLGRKASEIIVPTARQAEIANLVYGGRFGNVHSGDGWRYRGRGLKQITFYDNYLRCGHALELDLIAHPELLELDAHAANSAGWFWFDNGCNAYADRADIAGLTRVINGGDNALAERQNYFTQAKGVLCR